MRHRGPVAPSIFKTHPLTGEPIVPVGYVNSKPVWPICGGAPDDDDDDDEDKGTGDSGAGKKDDDGNADKDKDTGSDGDHVSRAEFDELMKRMQAADRRATEAEKKVKEAEDAKKDDLTKATERAEELEKAVEEKEALINSLRLEVAFLTANKHSWHDPDEALASAQRNGYLDDAVSEEGVVDKVRLGKALDRLAKEKPFLVKSDKDDRDDDPPPSGEPAGGRSDNGKDERAKQAQLRKRFPVLNR